jgi:hypothetical protein
MYNIGTPRKSQRKHPNSRVDKNKTPAASWPPENKEHLVFTLLSLVQRGVTFPFGPHLKKITNELHDHIGRVQYTKLQVKQMIDRLKANYKDFTMLLSGKVGTGFGWDHSSNTVTNSEDNWEQLKHVSNNSKSLSIYNFSNPNL